MRSNLTPLDIANRLHEEADQIVYGSGIDRILQSYGEVFYTGSYFLNVMVWPDIDITMVLESDPPSIEDFFRMGTEIAKTDGVISLGFTNFFRRQSPDLPEGLYWGGRLNMGSRDVLWKMDLWARDREALEENRVMMERMRQMMDEETRKLIVEVKHSLLTPEGRTPFLSGYKIYEAVLFEGLRERKDIIAYLRERGIEV
ncbi:hypothetical protein ACFL6S_14970 [Candidatus Poribacteria bacterium]